MTPFLPPPEGELSEEALEEIAGGGISDVLKKIKDFFVEKKWESWFD